MFNDLKHENILLAMRAGAVIFTQAIKTFVTSIADTFSLNDCVET